MLTHYAYTLKGHLLAQTAIAVSYIDLDGKLPRTPHGKAYLNGGTLRGPLRKAALNVALREVAGEKGMTLGQMYMIGQGVDTSREVNNESTEKFYDPIAEQRLRELNPFLNLMGRWKLAGRLEVQPLLTTVENLTLSGQGVRHDQFERDPNLVEWLSEQERDRLLKMVASAHSSMDDLNALREETKATKKAYRNTTDDGERQRLGEKLNTLKDQEKAIKEAREGSSESIKHPISGYESIAPGSELSSTLRIANGTAVDLGLLLHTLAEFSLDPRLGGHRGVGFGAVSGEWSVYQRGPGELRATEIGCVRLDDLGFVMEGAMLDEAWQAFRDAIPRMDLSAYLLEQARDSREA